MPIFQTLLLLFIGVPLLEIYLLITVGGVIGAIPTILIVIVTAVVGTFLLRNQGLYTYTRAQQQMAAGEVPTQAMFEGMLLLFSGALLLTPGFFTDAIGFLLLVPWLRQRLLAGVVARMASGHVQGAHYSSVDGGPFQASRRSEGGSRNTIEGEYTQLDD